MSITLNGIDTLTGELTESLSGGWVAKVELDVDEERLESGPSAGDAATLVFELGTTFVGTVIEGAIEAGRWKGRVVGGRGGLRKTLSAKFYTSVTGSIVVGDIMSASGEALDPTSDASMLAKSLSRWARSGTPREALSEFAKAAGGRWRVTRTGLVLLVLKETWAPVVADYDVIENRPDRGVTVIAIDDPMVKPGVTLDATKVAQVVTTWGGDFLRQTLTAASEDGKPRDLATRMFAQMSGASSLAINYALSYSATVTGQSGDELDVMPDDDRIKGTGLSKVMMRHGIPGLTVTVAPGAKCMIQFENGDPQKPYASLWPDGSSVLTVKLGSSNASESFVLGDVLRSVLSQLTVPTAMGPSGTPINAASFPTFLSQKHKLDA